MQTILRDNGARLVDKPAPGVTYLVPFNSDRFSKFNEPNSLYVTEFWIEYCIQQGKIVDWSESFLYTPSEFTLPLTGFSEFVIGISGFEDKDRSCIGRIASLLGLDLLIIGAVFTEKFSRSNTHLLVSDQIACTSVKISKAEEWGVPLVSATWLYKCLEKVSPLFIKGRNSPY
jgi:DNA replication regulator DPB11